MWTLNAFDDFPFHQAASPIDIPASSDRHFNDGYWFAFYKAGVYGFCGMRLHPNSNVLDGYAGVVHRGEQRNVRFSRALRPRTNELTAGPLAIEIVKPLEVQRLALGPNDIDLEFDVLVETAALFTESRTVHYRHGVMINDVLRYTGVCRATGWVSIDGERIEVDRWHAARDHSWGIRAAMGPRTPLGGLEEARDPRALRIWIPFECGQMCGFFHMHEDDDGNVLDFEGSLGDGDRRIELAAARHGLRYEDGSRRLTGGEYTLVDVEGHEYPFRFEVVCEPVDTQGFGYARGWSDGAGPGVWRGPEAIESNRFDVTDPRVAGGGEHLPAARRLGGTEFACSLEGPGGETGMAHVEHMIYGTYRPYGFEGPNPW